MAFRWAQARLFMVSKTEGLFTMEQLQAISAVLQRGAGSGIQTAWLLQAAGMIFFWRVLLRTPLVPRWVSFVGIAGSALLIAATLVMFVYPQAINWLKLLGVPGMLAEWVMAFWLLFKLPKAEERAQPTPVAERA